MKCFRRMNLCRRSLLMVAALCASIVAQAYDFTVDGIQYTITSAENLEVSATGADNKESMTELVIPATVASSDGTEYRVTSIGTRAFYGCGSPTVTIPSTVTTVGDGAFYHSSLQEVTIPGNVKNVSKEMFNWCLSLKKVVVQEGVESIGDDAFTQCENLEEVVLPEGVLSIGSSAFYLCAKVDLSLPSTLTTIGIAAFCGCKSLKSVSEIPAGVTEISTQAFEECEALTSMKIEGAATTTIGERAFYGCYGIETVSIGGGVTSLGEYAFGDCTSLSSAYILGNVETLSKNAFRGCTSLTTVWLGEKVSSLGMFTFYDSAGLSELYMLCPTPPTYSSRAFDNKLANMHLAIGASTAYMSANSWKTWAGAVTEDLLTIGETGYATAYSTNDLSFEGTGLTAYTVKLSGSEIAVSEITEVPAETGIIVKGEPGSYLIPLASSPAAVSDNSLMGVSSATTLTTDETTTYYTLSGLSIDYPVFEAVTTVELPAGQAYLPLATSAATSSILFEEFTSFVVDGLKYNILDGSTVELTMNGYTAESINIPDTVVYGGIKYGVISIGDNAFEYCTGLTSITIPASVTKIGAEAFKECSELTEIIVQGETPITDVQASSFDQTHYDSAELTVPSGSEDAYRAAEVWKEFKSLQETTGINNVSAVSAEGEYYSISGVRVAKPSKGLYIKNGKKVVVR